MAAHIPLSLQRLCLSLMAMMYAMPAGASETLLELLQNPINQAEKQSLELPPYNPTAPMGPGFNEARKQAQRDDGESLLEELRSLSQRGIHEFRIPPGDYRLPSSAPILISGLHDLAIEAEGATFWMERPPEQAAGDCWGLRFEDCARVRVHGLQIDYDPPVYMQGKITSMDDASGTLEVRIDEGYPVVDCRPLQVIFFNSKGEHIPQQPHFHRGAYVVGDRAIRFELETASPFREQSSNPKILAAFENRSRIAVGDYAVLPFRTGSALHLENCEEMRLESISLYAAPGMGFVESGGGGGHLYKDCRIVRRPGANRLWACNADCLHSRMLEKGSTVEGCEFSFCGDDFLNFHSFWHLVAHRESAARLAVIPHRYKPFEVGGSIEFYDQVSAESLGEAVIEKIEPVVEKEIIQKAKEAPGRWGFIPFEGEPLWLTLNHPVEAIEGSQVDSRSLNSPGVIVRNCCFHDSMGRGALVEGIVDALFENNVWRNCNGGMQIFSCQWFYVEGPFPQRIRVIGNRFIEADAIPSPVQPFQPINGVICVSLVANGGNYLRNVCHMEGMEIIGNTICRTRNYPILMAYCRDSKIRDNRIIEPFRYLNAVGLDATPAYYRDSEGHPNPVAAILTAKCRDIIIEGNRVEGMTDPQGREKASGPCVEDTNARQGD